jgi:hypothetical protein
MTAPALVANCTLEWWRSGERTETRLLALLAHFADTYRLDAEGRTIAERMTRDSIRPWEMPRNS